MTEYACAMHPQIVQQGDGSCRPVRVWAPRPFFVRAVQSVANRRLNMFTLSRVGVSVAYVCSLIAAKMLLGIAPTSARRSGVANMLDAGLGGPGAMTRRSKRFAMALVVAGSAASTIVDATPGQRPAAPPVALDAGTISRVARNTTAGIVFIHTVGDATTGSGEGLGSGVVVAPGGLIITNAHVVEGAARIHVRTHTGEESDAVVVASDAESDLALLRASDATGFVPVLFGDDNALEVGAFVVAIGNPYGLHHTVTMGILSAKARGEGDSGLEFLQTDAAVNPGSSGGGLFDLGGRLVGITTVMITPSGGGNSGLNLAIPVSVVKALLPQLLQGQVQHGRLGLSTRWLAGGPAKARGLSRSVSGMEILALAPDGPAALAGLQVGDVLLSAFLKREIPASRIHEAVWLSIPGTRIDLLVWRTGRTETIHAVIGPKSRMPLTW